MSKTKPNSNNKDNTVTSPLVSPQADVPANKDSDAGKDKTGGGVVIDINSLLKNQTTYVESQREAYPYIPHDRDVSYSNCFGYDFLGTLAYPFRRIFYGQQYLKMEATADELLALLGNRTIDGEHEVQLTFDHMSLINAVAKYRLVALLKENGGNLEGQKSEMQALEKLVKVCREDVKETGVWSTEQLKSVYANTELIVQNLEAYRQLYAKATIRQWLAISGGGLLIASVLVRAITGGTSVPTNAVEAVTALVLGGGAYGLHQAGKEGEQEAGNAVVNFKNLKSLFETISGKDKSSEVSFQDKVESSKEAAKLKSIFDDKYFLTADDLNIILSGFDGKNNTKIYAPIAPLSDEGPRFLEFLQGKFDDGESTPSALGLALNGITSVILLNDSKKKLESLKDTDYSGSHWTLLAIKPPLKIDGNIRIEHYDSMGGEINSDIAKQINDSFVAKKFNFDGIENKTTSSNAPQGSNGPICGLVAADNAIKIAEKKESEILNAGKLDSRGKEELNDRVLPKLFKNYDSLKKELNSRHR